MKNITVRTGERWERQMSHGRSTGLVRIATVEVWICGIRFVTDCTDDASARELAFRLGLEFVEP